MMYIWKEWHEQSRGMGLWIGIAMVLFISIFLMGEAKYYPVDLGFEAYLLSLFDMNIYFLPLFAMFLSSFSIFHEKELKTAMILLTKKESYVTFMLKKSVAIQSVIIITFIGGYFVIALMMKMLLPFHLDSYLHFLLTMTVFLLIFNQIGIFVGSICKTKMQLIASNIIAWFLFIFLIDLVFLQFLSSITLNNLRIFSWLYFLDPLHTLRFYLETSLGLFSLSHLSGMMEKFAFMEIWKFLLINAIIWPVLFFGLAIGLKSGVENHD